MYLLYLVRITRLSSFRRSNVPASYSSLMGRNYGFFMGDNGCFMTRNKVQDIPVDSRARPPIFFSVINGFGGERNTRDTLPVGVHWASRHTEN